jgi:hypothetical protein
LIDTHTHVLLQGDITAADYDEQLLKQSTAYRAILGTRSVRRALDYGFTTIRDLETEGAGYADVDLKKAINSGVIPGPRMKVATRAMDVTGAYPLVGYSPEFPCRTASRWWMARPGAEGRCEQMALALIDQSLFRPQLFCPPDGVPMTSTFPDDFAPSSMKPTASNKVASHAMALNGVHNSVEAGVIQLSTGTTLPKLT